MPARKTIAAQQDERLRRRKNLAVLLIGAIPVVILAIVAGVFLYQRATSLGDDELPSSIGVGERQEIQEAIEGFYGYVNQYNPEFIASTMLPVPELGNEEFSRLIMSVAPLESEKLTFRVVSLGTTSLDNESGVVNARVVTNFGPRDFRLVRRDGQWKLAAVPDLLVPQEAGPMRLEWSVVRSFVADPSETLPNAGTPPVAATPRAATPVATAPVGAGSETGTPGPAATPAPQKTLFMLGRIKNVSTEPGYVLGVNGFVSDGAGKTLMTARLPMPANPYLDPGEESYFQIQFRFPNTGENLDAANFVLVPDFRQVGRTDEATFVTDLVVIDPSKLPWQPGGELSTTVVNSDSREVTAQVFAYFVDGAGVPQFISPITSEIKLAPGTAVRVPVTGGQLPDVLSAVRAIEFRVFATPPRPTGR